MGRYDKSSKWLIEHHGDSLLRIAGVHDVVSWRPLQAELVQPTQLPDGILEVNLAGRAEPVLFVLELATFPDRRVATQAGRDAALVWLERGELPEMLAVVLCPKGNLEVNRFLEVESTRGRTHMRISWQVVELWTVPAESLLQENDVGLVPWVTLAQFQRPPEEVFRACRERIDDLAPPGEHDNLLAVTQVLARLRFDDPILFSLLGGRKAMIESPLLRELEDAAERRGWANAAVKYILAALRDRFGEVDESVKSALRSIEDENRLESLFHAALHCPHLHDFQAELNKVE
jgi:hypothetical protein